MAVEGARKEDKESAAAGVAAYEAQAQGYAGQKAQAEGTLKQVQSALDDCIIQHQSMEQFLL